MALAHTTPTLDMDPVRLDAADLTSKWGFGDGDTMYDAVREWRVRAWPAEDYPVPIDPDDFFEDPFEDHAVRFYTRSDALLGVAIRERILPLLGPLPDGITVSCHSTLHNPFRLMDGDEEVPYSGAVVLDSDAYADVWRQVNAVSVDLTAQDLLELADLAYPRRAPGWVRLHRALSVLPAFHFLSLPAEPLLSVPTFTIGHLVDAYAASVPDEALGLAADLLDARPEAAAGVLPSVIAPVLDEVMAAAMAAATSGTLGITLPQALTHASRGGLLPRTVPAPLTA